MTDRNPVRVVQWTTGNIAREAVPTVLGRDDMQLVGVFAFSPAKVGVDVADLVGLDAPTGVAATDDIDELLALDPDCVVYSPLHFNINHVERILAAGVNIVTTTAFMTGRTLPAGERNRVIAAAEAGGASIFGGGMNPGFSAVLTAVGAGISREVRHVRVSESVDVSLFAGDENFDLFGWARPAGDREHSADLEYATRFYKDGLEVLGDLLGLSDYEMVFTANFAHATEDLDLPGRPIPAGTVAGIDIVLEAVVDGVPRIEMHQRYVMGSAIEPAWTVEHGYRVDVLGNPRVGLRLEILPDLDDYSLLTVEEMYAIGMRISAVPLIDAIPAVCAAAPGIRTYADIALPSAYLGGRS